jgi:hypothetical protein
MLPQSGFDQCGIRPDRYICVWIGKDLTNAEFARTAIFAFGLVGNVNSDVDNIGIPMSRTFMLHFDYGTYTIL